MVVAYFTAVGVRNKHRESKSKYSNRCQGRHSKHVPPETSEEWGFFFAAVKIYSVYPSGLWRRVVWGVGWDYQLHIETYDLHLQTHAILNAAAIYDIGQCYDRDDNNRSTEALLMQPNRTASLCPYAFRDNCSWSVLDWQHKCIISEQSFVIVGWNTFVKAPCGTPLYPVVPYGQSELLQNQGWTKYGPYHAVFYWYQPCECGIIRQPFENCSCLQYEWLKHYST